jgi:hypothetical protein
MKLYGKITATAIGLCLALQAHAGEPMPDLALRTSAGRFISQQEVADTPNYHLALNETSTADSIGELDVTPYGTFQPPLFTGSNAHKYLGLGTLALVVATALAPKPPEVEDRAPTPAELDAQKSSSHAKLGRAAATMAAATVATGLLYHWDDFHLEDGFSDPDNQHAMLGVAGALAMLYAISKAPDEGHAGSGIAGGAAMAVAIKLTW